jgi:hypothetical protein
MMKTKLNEGWFAGFRTYFNVNLPDYQERVVEDMLEFAAMLYLIERLYPKYVDELTAEFMGIAEVKAESDLDDDLVTAYSEYCTKDFSLVEEHLINKDADKYPHRARAGYRKVVTILHILGVQHAAKFMDKYRELFARHLTKLPLLPQAAFVLACEEAGFDLAEWAEFRPALFSSYLDWLDSDYDE